MKAFFCLLAAGLLAGCASHRPYAAKTSPAEPQPAPATFSDIEASRLPHPLDPEAKGLGGHTNLTSAEVLDLKKDALERFKSVFGSKLPPGFILDAPPAAWYDASGSLRQIRAMAYLPRSAFREDFPMDQWTQIIIPAEYVSEMQLPAPLTREDITCFLGLVKGKPAYLFWSDLAQYALLVVDV